ncbi:folate-binding protein [Aurantiacibacter sp. MUD11]|uniref:CAF17-like 4Fe-4S cluster assembly/insertion protein YgfZ n=1 Tax=Aurantiacibacter sp. MUD11 TaxID=3003265 RepID=UPI0022AB49AD|nr:folate-binding protein [Aurantiacibacter sp. MUD11]WAT17841.1 folate-binding protein [Aurantiacibacter sp. MUD11]
MSSTCLTSRAVVRVSATDQTEDPAAFLQGLLTNDVTGDLPGYAALLTAQGKTMFDMIVWRDGADLLLDCEADQAEDLVKRLSLYRLRRKLAIAVDDSLKVHWQAEPREGAAADPRLAALGHRWLSTEAGEAADHAWQSHRLALGVPEGHTELADILWLETNAVELNGVSFTKGCYIGQENTARMNWRQKVNRRLVIVPLDRSEEKRRKVAYPELGLAVDHLRVDDIPADLKPAWLEL